MFKRGDDPSSEAPDRPRRSTRRSRAADLTPSLIPTEPQQEAIMDSSRVSSATAGRAVSPDHDRTEPVVQPQIVTVDATRSVKFTFTRVAVRDDGVVLYAAQATALPGFDHAPEREGC
jgi:hypothetical protein